MRINQLFVTGKTVPHGCLKVHFIQLHCMDTIKVTHFSFHSYNNDAVDRRIKVTNQCALTTNTNNTGKESFAGDLKFITVKP